jgi:hypothetical protein
MKNTRFAADVPATTTYNIPNIITTKGDLKKFKFTVANGGKYEGKQVISPKAAAMLLGITEDNL